MKADLKKINSDYKNFQVGYIALYKQGVTGAYAIHQYFSMPKNQDVPNESIQSDYMIKV